MDKDTILKFSSSIEGEVYHDDLHQLIYATDASAYRELPIAIVVAQNNKDVIQSIQFARENNIAIIPRTAGTSLAGQVVGKGLVVDCSKYMNKILEVNAEEKWVRVQPGVVLDELNLHLKQHGLFFGPETSTSNRCMIGGMVGNNSCGAHSLVYGSTREHTLEVKAILSNGDEVVFGDLTALEFEAKTKLETLEGELYRSIYSMLSDEENASEIEKEFPDIEVERRNTGYALDMLLRMQPFNTEGQLFNFCSLICGSEGTLAFITEIKLNLVPLPPVHKGLLVVHHNSIAEAIEANVHALEHKPTAIELIDKYFLDCTKDSREHKHNRFFLKGEPGALLCVEFAEESEARLKEKAEQLKVDFETKGFGFHFPLLQGADIGKVWALRKAGLGLLSGVPGDAKPQPVIEDTAIHPKKLLAYITEFNKVLDENKLECVFYAHIATGELHLRPVINLKEKKGVEQFRIVATEIARLVKKYGGSLSGEHGDGRLRGEFIPMMIGEKNYSLLLQLKKTWDANGVFNKGKITDTPPMDSSLRFVPDQQIPEIDTMYDFSDTLGLLRMAEKCNGSADCRKSALVGGTMCPSFQATKDEKNTTRARANMLREILNSNNKANTFNNKELNEVLDLCLSCKGCKTECPSGIDMAKMKSEFLWQYYQSHVRPLRHRIIAGFANSQMLATKIAGVYNGLISWKLSSRIIKASIGFAKDRSLPKVNRLTWRLWLKRKLKELNKNKGERGQLYMFVDEFTNYNEAQIGITAVKLLSHLGYKVNFIRHPESGRSKLSKGFLKSAKRLAEKNVQLFSSVVTKEKPLIGIEPSAILCFRDEYPDLLRGDNQEKAKELAQHTFTIEEFIANEFELGNIKADQFSKSNRVVHYHGHCQQKALVGTKPAKTLLNIPENYSVQEINSGCCGMAGAFGYEKEHFELANKIGEMVLFPAVRNSHSKDLISASGTSCRHHIKDGTGKNAVHPVEILWDAII